jgi:tetratricopeptide (TPR) repeat protein
MRPDSTAALYSKGAALLRLGKYEEAVGCLNRAIELRPDEGSLFRNKGLCELHMGRYEEALASFNRAAELDPMDGSSCEGKAQSAYYVSFICEDAERVVEEAFRASAAERVLADIMSVRMPWGTPPKPSGAGNAGDEPYYMAVIREAESAIERALSIDPAKSSYLNTKGAILIRSGRCEEAARVFEDAFRKRNEHRFVYNRAVALASLALRKEAETEEALSRALEVARAAGGELSGDNSDLYSMHLEALRRRRETASSCLSTAAEVRADGLLVRLAGMVGLRLGGAARPSRGRGAPAGSEAMQPILLPPEWAIEFPKQDLQPRLDPPRGPSIEEYVVCD